MPRKKKQKINKNLGRKFILFVKPIEKDSEDINFEETEDSLLKSGWLKTNPKVELVFSYKDAAIFEEKEEGHGSSSDWINFFKEEYPHWDFNPPRYLDEIDYSKDTP